MIDKKKVEAVVAKVEGLAQREKIILLATVLVAILGFFFEVVWTPNGNEQKSLQSRLTSAVALNDSLTAQQQVLARALREDPDTKLRKENKRLAAQLAAKRQQLKASLSRLVSPEDMPELLTELLAAIPELEVREVIKLPVRKVQQGEGEGASVLYSHRVKIVVAGRYFDAMRYVRKIEAEPSRLRLLSMESVVAEYPQAVMELELETLGLNQRWLGV